MNEQIDFLKRQNRCIDHIYERIKLIKVTINQFKKQLKENTLALEPNYYLLNINNQIKQLSILIKEFNHNEFVTIESEVIDSFYHDLIYGSRKRRKNGDVA